MAEIIRNLKVPWETIGKEELDRGDVAAARVKCQRALQGAQTTGDPLLEADAWTRLAEIDGLHKSDYLSAKASYLKALALVQRVHDRPREANIRWFLATTYLGLAETQDALENFGIALQLVNEASDLDFLPYGYWGVGFASARAGRTQAAQHHYVLALVAAWRNKNTQAERTIWLGLGDLAAILHNYDAADQMLAIGQALPERYYNASNLDKLRQEALAEYERDKGHSLLKKAFPDVDIDSLLEE